MEFPNEKLIGNLWGERTPSPSLVVKFNLNYLKPKSKAWIKYLEKELSKSGGLDGFTKTEHGYTNQPFEEKKVA